MTTRRVAIIGAGTAGLVQAIALRTQLGDAVELHVFEKEPGFNLQRGVQLAVGPGFQIVMSALGRPDFGDHLRKFGCAIHGPRVLSCTGEAIEHVQAILESNGMNGGGEAELESGERWKICPHQMNRGVLMDLLLQCVWELGEDPMHWNHKLEAIQEDDHGLKTLLFEDGSVYEGFDLVVGADGVRSTVRQLLFDLEEPRHVGCNIVYGLMERDPGLGPCEKFHIICSNGFSTVSSVYKTPEGNQVWWWAMVQPHSQGTEEQSAWTTPDNLPEFAMKMVESDPEGSIARKLIQNTSEFKYAGQFVERDPDTLGCWGTRRVVLIGDAVHALQPWAGMGASMAAEDGFVLGELIVKYGFEQLDQVFSELRDNRISRIKFFRQITLNNTPDGIIPVDDLVPSIDSVVHSFGDHRPVQASPAWEKAIKNINIEPNHDSIDEKTYQLATE